MVMSSVVTNGRSLKLLRDFAALSGGNLLSKLAGFLAFAYLARTLGPEGYGAVEFAVAVSLFFAMIIDCGLGPIGVRELSGSRERIASLAAQIPSTRLVIASIAIPIMGLTAIVATHSHDTTLLVWFFAIALIAVPWNLQWLLQSQEMMGRVAVGQVIRPFVFAIGIVLFVGSTRDLVRVGVIEVVAAISMASYYVIVQHLSVTPVKLDFSSSQLRHLAKEGVSVGLAQVVWAFHQYAPIVLVANFVGGNETAWFGAAHRIVLSLYAFSWLYHFNLFPVIARRVRASKTAFNELLQSSLRIVSWVGIPLALVLTLLARPILEMLFGQPYATAAPSFAILVWVLPVATLGGHARWSLIAVGQQEYVLIAQIAGAVGMLVAGVILIPKYHAVGAAISMLTGNLLVSLTAHLFATRRIGSFPLYSPVGPPALLALVAGLSIHLIGSSAWTSAAIATSIFVVFAPLLNTNLLSDFKRLATAKGDV